MSGSSTAATIGSFDYAQMTKADLADHALDAGEQCFLRLVAEGKTTGDALHMRLTTRNRKGVWREVGTRTIGEGEQYAVNTTGKSRTCANREMDSDLAFMELGDAIPEGPERWTGGVFYVARIVINGTTYTKEIIAACSGVQGEVDKQVSYAIVLAYATAWVLRKKMRLALAA